MEDVHNLINIDPTNFIQILYQHEKCWRVCLCPSNDTYDKNKNIWKSVHVLGLEQQGQEVY